MTVKSLLLPISIFCCIIFTNCDNSKNSLQSSLDQVSPFVLTDIRLGDGVPIQLKLSVRWMMESPNVFRSQFETPMQFSSLILQPRAYEVISSVSNFYPSVDSVFYSHRQVFIEEIKDVLSNRLGGEEAAIKEVIISDILFPESYTTAMEQVGLQKQLLEQIHQQSIVDVAKAEANKEKAEADAKVAISQAEADARVQKIKATTEKDRRQNELAIAETEAQIAKRQAEVDATRQKLLAKANLEKLTDLKNLEIQKQDDLLKLAIERERMMAKVDREGQLELAKMYQENPTYASFIVNKELAGKVEIAVLPTSSDSSVFGNFLKQTIHSKDNNN